MPTGRRLEYLAITPDVLHATLLKGTQNTDHKFQPGLVLSSSTTRSPGRSGIQCRPSDARSVKYKSWLW